MMKNHLQSAVVLLLPCTSKLPRILKCEHMQVVSDALFSHIDSKSVKKCEFP